MAPQSEAGFPATLATWVGEIVRSTPEPARATLAELLIGAMPGGGLDSMTQRRQGVCPGRIVIVWPSLPRTPPKIHGLPSFTAASLMR